LEEVRKYKVNNDEGSDKIRDGDVEVTLLAVHLGRDEDLAHP
jgi:hypothetical protein